MKKILVLLFSLMLIPCLGFADTCTFDGKGFELDENTHWGGTGTDKTGFSCENFEFPHTASQYSWSGFLYSAHRDTETAGFSNSYSAITKKGYENSSNYGVSYFSTDWMDLDKDGDKAEIIPNKITLKEPKKLNGFYITNTTYAYLSMKNGDAYAKKFGGDSGNDKDWFKLTIDGLDKDGKKTATVDFYLADFRFDNNSEDYITKDWEFVDLSSLGEVKSLSMTLSSSDTGQYGMNTPAYIAIDSIETDSDGGSSVSCFVTSISEDVSKNSIAFFILGLSAFLMVSFKRKRD